MKQLLIRIGARVQSLAFRQFLTAEELPRFAITLTICTVFVVCAGDVSSHRLQADGAAGDADPRFEVASVRQNKSAEARPLFDMRGLPTGTARFTAMSAMDLIRLAHGRGVSVFGPSLDAAQIIDGPDWLTVNRYDIVAKFDPALGQPQDGEFVQVTRMLRNLLIDRFGLEATETVSVRAGLALRLSGGKLRDTLPNAAGTECGRLRAAQSPEFAAAGCGMRKNTKGLIARAITMGELARALINEVDGKTVKDETGLEGLFDFRLEFSRLYRPGGEPILDEHGTVFQAVQDQLGLTLATIKLEEPVVIIRKIALPTDN